MIESSIVLYQHEGTCTDSEIVTIDIGHPASVEFDFFSIWEFKKKLGVEFNPRNLRFHHVHPSGLLAYSETDLNCVKGLKIALNDISSFSIICFECPDINSLKSDIVSFKYDGEEPNKLKQIKTEKLDDTYLFLLKYLSYYRAIP